MMKFPEKVNLNTLFDYYRETLENIIDSQDEQKNLTDFSINLLEKFQNKILRQQNRTLE